jgi:hypothetical protein
LSIWGVIHHLDVEALLAEIALEQVAQAKVVIDDENPIVSFSMAQC